MLPDSYTRTISAGREVAEEQSPEQYLDSPHAQAFSKPYSPSLDRLRHGSFALPSRQSSSISMDSLGMQEQHEWSEGLSMVPEESYAKMLLNYQLLLLRMVRLRNAHRCFRALEFCDISHRQPSPVADTSSPSYITQHPVNVSIEEQAAAEGLLLSKSQETASTCHLRPRTQPTSRNKALTSPTALPTLDLHPALLASPHHRHLLA